MLRGLLGKLLLIHKMLPGGDSPRQLALGLSLGLLLGLIPKGNLTAVAISMLIFASTVNLGTALLTAAAVTSVAAWLDPITDRVGQAVLTHESLQPLWSRFYDLPFAPWTDLNNTVVASPRILIPIMELYQNKDGAITVPTPLRQGEESRRSGRLARVVCKETL